MFALVCLGAAPPAGAQAPVYWERDVFDWMDTGPLAGRNGWALANGVAGTFKTWRAEVTSAEGEPGVITLWIDSGSRRVVRTTASLPQMGGATITSELQP